VNGGGTMSEKNEQIDEIVARYEEDEGMLIPMMQDLQAACGYLPPDQLRRLSDRLGVPLARIYGVATFYASFRLAPRGEHEVTLCMGTVCHLKGAGDIAETICREFQVEAGGTTPDRLFTFLPVNCVGACALAPVMVVDGVYHDHMTSQSAVELLRNLPAKADAPEKEARA